MTDFDIQSEKMGNFFSEEKEPHFSTLNENLEDKENSCDILEEKTKSRFDSG